MIGKSWGFEQQRFGFSFWEFGKGFLFVGEIWERGIKGRDLWLGFEVLQELGCADLWDLGRDWEGILKEFLFSSSNLHPRGQVSVGRSPNAKTSQQRHRSGGASDPKEGDQVTALCVSPLEAVCFSGLQSFWKITPAAAKVASCKGESFLISLDL